MFQDSYGNAISTRSQTARDAYDNAVEIFLAAGPHGAEAFESVVAADEGFALGHIGLARTHQMFGRREACLSALARARDLSAGITAREVAHVDALGLLMEGKAVAAAKAIYAHVREYPRDVMVAQTLMGVFGVVGFSDQPGREAEMLAVAEWLAPYYPEDWWFLSFLGFAQLEVGRFWLAEPNVQRSLELNPRAAHAAHVRGHFLYEIGETDAGLAFLSEWMKDYHPSGLMHCHNSWHTALWALASGDIARMWSIVDADLNPEISTSPPLNVLTDIASIYSRAEMAGVPVAAERWRAVSAYASRVFPKPGVAFADVHAALAHAMAGDGEALEKIRREASGPAADLVRHCGEAFQGIVQQNWEQALAALMVVMADHERIGGSRAQRDLVEYTTANVLIRLGKGDEAARLLAMRRPKTCRSGVIQGLPAPIRHGPYSSL